MTKLLLMAMPFSGHVAPLTAVATELVRRSHDARVYSGRAFQSWVESAGARWRGWLDAPDFDEHDLAATFPRLRGRPGPTQALTSLADLFIATGPAQLADLEAEWRRDPWDVLVAEESTIAPRLCAEKLGCAWATVTVMPLGLPSREGPPHGHGLQPGCGSPGQGSGRDPARHRTRVEPCAPTSGRPRAALGDLLPQLEVGGVGAGL